MPPDDRERSFESALASHLRAGSSASDSRGACSDAEILSAYHERSLAPEQMASVKTHVTDCERCRQILAHLDATDEIAVAAANTARQATGASNSSVRVLHGRRPTLWRWVAPAGALAAALLVWVAVHEDKSVRIPLQASKVDLKQAETVKNLPAPSSSLTSPPLDAKKETPSSDSRRALPPSSQAAGAPKPPPQLLFKQKDSSNAGKKSWVADDSAQMANNSLNREASPAPEEALQSRAELAERIEAAKADAAKIVAENKAVNGRRDAPSPGSRQQPAPSPAPARSAMAGAVPAVPSGQAQAPSEPAGASGGVTQQQEIGGMSKFSEKPKMRLANSISAVTISAPGGLVSWQVGQTGYIEFSADAGKTWTLQLSGVRTDLLGGSAPSEKVCWIVGGAGTILRTTDGGAHWQKLPAPVQDDIRAVFAVDARRATVSLTNGSYQTTDGGATWNKLAPE
jgi:Photosynthesis system II assembly factor YCF48/Putative zinc-finger